MLISCILLAVGLLLVVFGADYLVDGASGIARRSGLSEFIIGLTIVGMGTSAPEMVVSLIGAIEGKGDIAVGNVIGSNIFNTLLILGVTAVILPIGITRSNKKTDIPVNIAVTLAFILISLKNTIFGIGADGISRLDAIVLLLLFAAYMWHSFVHSDKTPQEDSPEKEIPVWKAVLMIVGGLAALAGGGRLFVDSATDIARAIGVSDKFIAITILAGGTSLPELATCISAAVKKKGQLALGNIIGSNLFNILLILGGSAAISPITFLDISMVDMGVLLVSSIVLATSVRIGKKDQLDRTDGILFLLVWAAYMTYLFIKL